MSKVEDKTPEVQNKMKAAIAAVLKSENKQKKQQGGVDPVLIAWIQIFHSVQLGHQLANIQVNEMQKNLVAQNNTINEEQMLNFIPIPQDATITMYTPNGPIKIKVKPSQALIQQITTKNQEIAALRNNKSDVLTVLKQDAQISETKINTVMNENQRTITQGSGLLNMLVGLTNQINRS